ncbi:AAA family ATPase [Nocardia nova]
MARIRTVGGIVLAFSNTKGGVGKSTESLNVAIECAQRGASVLIIDTDTQQTIMDALTVRQAPAPVTALAYPHKEIWQDLPRLRAGYDVTVIDGQGRHDEIARAVVAATVTYPHGVVVVPVGASPADVWAVKRDMRPILTEADRLVPWPIKARTLLSRYSPRELITAAAIEALATNPIAPPTAADIQDRTIYTQSLARGRAVCEIEPGGAAAAEIAALATELITLALEEETSK